VADSSTRTRSGRGSAVVSSAAEPARAQARFVRVTPMKMRRVVDLIRGQRADQALAVLRFAPQAAGEPVYKVLASAVANARYRAEQESRRLDVEDLVVQTAYVDEGPTLKRFRPRAQGRAFRVRKRSSHITIVVAPHSPDAGEPPKARTKKSAKRSVAKRPTAKSATAKKSPAAKAASTSPAKRTASKKAADTTKKVASTTKKATNTKATAKKTSAKKAASKAAGDADSSTRRAR